VRVDIDETETWRIHPGRAALARLRGNPEISAPLAFVRFEPYVLPKRSLTGETTERVDTRVLQAIYEFAPSECSSASRSKSSSPPRAGQQQLAARPLAKSPSAGLQKLGCRLLAE
jgi:HlyD family secretion protein